MERPRGATRDWSAAGVENQRRDLSAFEARWKSQDDPKAPIAQQVDHRLLGSALARVHWELDILKRWQRDPNFYIEQAVTPVGEALTVPGPYDGPASKEISARLNSIPALLNDAKKNLASPPAPFATMAIDSLAGIRPEAATMAKTLAPQTTIPEAEWEASADRAAASLETTGRGCKRRSQRFRPKRLSDATSMCGSSAT